MPNIEAVCVEKGCGNKFYITESEQAFYKSKNFALPKRCPSCRKKRRLEKQREGYSHN